MGIIVVWRDQIFTSNLNDLVGVSLLILGAYVIVGVIDAGIWLFRKIVTDLSRR